MLVPQLQLWSQQLCLLLDMNRSALRSFPLCVALAGPGSSGALNILPLSG